MVISELEDSVETYLCKRVREHGGDTRKLQWVGRRGAGDRLVVFPGARLYFVELKRPKGGRVSVHQDLDAEWCAKYGLRKEFLYTREQVDKFITRAAP